VSELSSRNGLGLKYYYFVYFTILAAFTPYLPLYLREHGIRNIQIGSLMAIGPLVTIVAQPLWGMFSDYLQNQVKVLRFTLLFCMVSILLFTISIKLWWLYLVMAIYTFFQSPNVPLADSITLSYLKSSKAGFGSIRLWGSLGFSVAVLGIGRFFAVAGLNYLFVLISLLFLLSLLATVGLPRVQGTARPKLGHGAWKLLSNRSFLVFVIFTCLVQITFSAYNTFFGLYFTSLGGTTSSLGLAWMLSALSEIPFFYYGDVLLRRYGPTNLLRFAALVFGARWVLYPLLKSPEAVLAAQLFQGLSFGLFYLAAVHYASSLSPRELLATGQSLFSSITFGLGSTLGSFVGGILVHYLGLNGLFWSLAVIAFTAVIFFTRLLKIPV
jgi:PPP family 3-phenylpropionic acid transporter